MTSAAKQFPDIGLRFGVFDAMLRTGTLQESDLEPLLQSGVNAVKLEDNFWYEEEGERLWDDDNFPDDVLQHVLDHLGDLDLSEQQLGSVTTLHFDGGNNIYMYFENHTADLLGLEGWELGTGGHSELYTVNSFVGVEVLHNLTFVNLDAYGYTTKKRDLSPFESLTGLQEFVIYSPRKQFTNIEAIAHLLE